MKVIKRDGREVEFDGKKIENAILKAMKNGSGIVRPQIATDVALEIEKDFMYDNLDEVEISTIESKVFDKLIDKGERLTAKAYEGYRKVREFQRDSTNTTDVQIAEMLSGTSEYWSRENSNKDVKLVTTQRDYMAGIISTDMSRRFLLSPEVVQAHDDGLIHFHDMDYFGQDSLSNCCLINLEDMLQNGTVVNGKMIEKPHKFSTACTIATQIITAVASSQYGGCTISLTHLAPFVKSTYEKFLKKYISWGIDEETAKDYALKDTKTDIKDGVQTFNYQVNSMSTTNG